MPSLLFAAEEFTASVCVFITAGPITKLFAGGGRRRVEDMCYDRRLGDLVTGIAR